MDVVVWSSLMGTLPCLLLCWLKGQTLLLVMGSFATWASAMYHGWNEQSKLLHNLDMASVVATLVIHYVQQAQSSSYNLGMGRHGGWLWLLMDRTSLMGHALALLCWRLGCGRHCSRQRSWRYTVFHSLFHLVMGVVFVRELLFL